MIHSNENYGFYDLKAIIFLAIKEYLTIYVVFQITILL